MNGPHDDQPVDELDGEDFETRLRRDLRSTAAAAAASTTWRDVVERSRRRDRTVRTIGGVGLLLAVVTVAAGLVVLPRPTSDVRLESAAGPPTEHVTDSRPSEMAHPVDPVTAPRPQADLVLSTGSDLQVTDLDGVLLETPAWQPTPGAGPIGEVVVHPDGSAVVVWHRDCLLEAGSLVDGADLQIPNVVDGTPLPATADGGGCSGPAAFSPDGTAIAWTSGAEGQGRLYTAAWTPEGVDPGTINPVSEDDIDLAATRVVGWGDDDRILVRQRRADATELYALQVRSDGVAGAIAVADFLSPAFEHVDGRVVVDAAADQVLDVVYTFPQGDTGPGVIDGFGIHEWDDSAGFGRGGMAELAIDPMAIWFDAWGSIRVVGVGDGTAEWLGSTGSTLYGPFPIGRGVTAVAIVPGTERVEAPLVAVEGTTSEAGPATTTEQPADAQDAPVGQPSTAWCAERLLVAVVTTAAGALEALCADGSSVPFADDGHHHPSLGTDHLLVQRAAAAEGTSPQIVAFDVGTGESQVIADGSTPASAANGAVAWVAGGGVQRSDAVDAPSAPIGPPLPALGVMRLSWDRDGRWLFISLGDPGGPLEVWALDTHDTAAAWQPLTLEDGGEAVVAVAGESDTPDAAALLVRASDGQLTVAGAVLAEGPRTLPFPRITGLAPVEGTETFDAGDFFPLIEPVGLATVQQEGDATSWQRGRTIGWLVGDGRRLWLAGGPGDAVFIREDVAMISVTPALDSPGSLRE